MAGSRTLKLSILADVADLKKNLDTGSKEVEGFGGKLEKFGKVAAAAFAAAAAAAAAYAVKLAVDGVKAAIEDEAAQLRLANALKNVTGATQAQISAVEQQILKTSLATGVADDQLRPALQRLAVATGSVTESQDLLNIAGLHVGPAQVPARQRRKPAMFLHPTRFRSSLKASSRCLRELGRMPAPDDVAPNATR